MHGAVQGGGKKTLIPTGAERRSHSYDQHTGFSPSCSPEDLSSHFQVIDCLAQWWPSKSLITSSLNVVLNVDLFMLQ